jgi:hypothetical protein
MPHSRRNRNLIHFLPVYGCITTGIIYFSIGVIAILSFLKIRDGGADESSMFAVLNDFFVGKLLIWIILLGCIGYVAWRFYESITDPYGYGKEMKGIAKRLGIALSTITDILIVSAAVRVLLGAGDIQLNGQPDEERAMVRNILQIEKGNWIVIGIGAIVLITAVLQFLYGITKGYNERVDIDRYKPAVKNAIHILAWVGYFARGLIVGIIGFFYIKAGVTWDAHDVVNTDKAFDFIGDNIGHLYFILVALGTMCYGLFMFVQGVAYDSDKD